jgi:hypothetical protein
MKKTKMVGDSRAAELYNLHIEDDGVRCMKAFDLVMMMTMTTEMTE